MDLDRLMSLRPKDDSSHAIAEAIQAAEAALAEAKAEIPLLESAESDALLSGTMHAMSAATERLTAQHALVKKIGFLIETLKTRKKEAVRAEAVARLNALADEANEAARRAATLLRDEYAEHAEAIREIMLAEQEALQKLRRYAVTARTLEQTIDGASYKLAGWPADIMPRLRGRWMHELVRLPTAEGVVGGAFEKGGAYWWTAPAFGLASD